MTYQQPGNWSDPSWPQQGKQDAGYPGYPVSGEPIPQGYAAPMYPGYGYPPPQRATNGLAIASLVCSLAGLATCISAPVGAILGHIARRQIRERGEGGEGLALAGIIVGWILTGLLALVIAFYVVIIVIAVNAETSSTY
ncbi:hypothetical protein GCM10022251_07250 [Phytohabitans flavus]|uniref:DUF4190 domain-containing protein n=1 Tax=Phytohabitans flavus TaxID=1076124 RepID=A0A6F8Y213_9ACTN|nr:hypothetical protein Pflav_065070 [Phytohabitans flavus]